MLTLLEGMVTTQHPVKKIGIDFLGYIIVNFHKGIAGLDK